VRELSQAFALAVPHEEALRSRDDVAFFQAVQAVLAKRAPSDARPEEDLDHAARQFISRVVSPEGGVLVDETLRTIARELVDTVRKNATTIDWALRQTVRAQLRVLVKRILRKHGYPPDEREEGDADGAGAGGLVVRELGRGLTGAADASVGHCAPDRSPDESWMRSGPR
jgi:hypothetical protein